MKALADLHVHSDRSDAPDSRKSPIAFMSSIFSENQDMLVFLRWSRNYVTWVLR